MRFEVTTAVIEDPFLFGWEAVSRHQCTLRLEEMYRLHLKGCGVHGTSALHSQPLKIKTLIYFETSRDSVTSQKNGVLEVAISRSIATLLLYCPGPIRYSCTFSCGLFSRAASALDCILPRVAECEQVAVVKWEVIRWACDSSVMCRWTNKMHSFLQIIFIFIVLLYMFRTITCPSSGASSSKLYHAFGTFVQASPATIFVAD